MTETATDVAVQYESVIKALMPFASRGRLSEGLNKLRARINKKDLEAIRYEVSRLLAPCMESTNSRKFARGRVRPIRVNDDVEVHLDSVGERILNAELKRYNSQYTQGVFEAISSESRYKDELGKEELKKKIEAFAVDCVVGSNDISPERAKVLPNFSLKCEKLEAFPTLPVHYLSKREVALQFAKKPQLSIGEVLTFTFPPLSHKPTGELTFQYQCTSIEALPGKGGFAAVFVADPEQEGLEAVEEFVTENLHKLPLVADQEETRTRLQLLKDTVITNTTQRVTLCSLQKDTLIPQALLTPTGHVDDYLDPNLPTFHPGLLSRLSKEFANDRETYQFYLQQDLNGEQQEYCAHLGELIKDKMLASFVGTGLANGSLRVLRLSLVSRQDELMRSMPDVVEPLPTYLQRCKFVLYSQDVSAELAQFMVDSQTALKPLPLHYHVNAKRVPVMQCAPMEEERRQEARFTFDVEAKVKTGLFSSTDARICDVSPRGLSLVFTSPPAKLKNRLSISIEEMGLEGVSYEVVYYNPAEGLARCSLVNDEVAERIETIMAMNRPFFDQHNVQQMQRMTFDYLWQFACHSLPGVHILLSKDKRIKDQLIVAHTDGHRKSLAPFMIQDNKLPTHGWIADAEPEQMTSTKLNNLVSGKEIVERALFYINRGAGKYTNVSDELFNKADSRRKMYAAMARKQGYLVAHSMTLHRYQQLTDTWYQRRCQKLAQVDRLAISRIRKQETQCVHMLSVLPVSRLHQHLLKVGQFEQKTGASAAAQG
ncbi:PilZ domain-containing protein [Aestuariibacter halophilus]|uniref:PilZ domain-containing protein n=1 Tax=Fluctibacter halophilus TaxID=226011 RepID=A0ABS8G426_9ALTE|nr:PilZ domain-containing protein [Aestuariibacter halophilus]MCC2615233.1 PilZ domain-containing protein [Aestuariibacter halophilus]